MKSQKFGSIQELVEWIIKESKRRARRRIEKIKRGRKIES